jgi:hypothetical protein
VGGATKFGGEPSRAAYGAATSKRATLGNERSVTGVNATGQQINNVDVYDKQ